jgi:lysozyme
MTAGEAKLQIQELLGIPASERFPNLGPKSQAAWDALKASPNDSPWPPRVSTERHINADGLELVKHFEGFYLTAYKDPVGIYTIGYGHTGLTHQDGTVYPGRKITKAEAEQLLKHDMGKFESRVTELVKVPLNDNQFSALVSFDFNTGGLGKSTLLKKLNAGDYSGAKQEFTKWIYAGGKKLTGLVRRRNAEAALFDSQDWRKFLT